MSNRNFSPFTTLEDQFLIHLLKSHTGDRQSLERVYSLIPEINWEYLKTTSRSFQCFLSFSNEKLNLNFPLDVTNHFKQTVSRNIAANNNRLEKIKRLAQYSQNNNIPLMFLKGGASLVLFAEKKDFIALETMGDVDFLCYSPDIDKLHQYLIQTGENFYDYGLSGLISDAKIKQFSLQTGKHLIYNYNQWETQLELHNAITTFEFVGSYPDGFANSLWEHLQDIPLDQTIVKIPLLEHLVTYCICHAAGLDMLDNMLTTVWEHKKSRNNDFQKMQKNGWGRVFCDRVNEHQIKYLIKLWGILYACNFQIDWFLVQSLLNRVENQKALIPYIQLANLVFGDAVPLKCDANWDEYKENHNQLLSSYVTPQVCREAKLKSIVCDLPGYKLIKCAYLYLKLLGKNYS